MAEVKYQSEGEQIRFQADAIKLSLGGFRWAPGNRLVNRPVFEQLRRENPDVTFLKDVKDAGSLLST